MTNFGQQETETINAYKNMNQSAADADFDIQKGAYNNDSSIASSSFKSDSVVVAGEEIVCRICLGTEDEGTPGEDG